MVDILLKKNVLLIEDDIINQNLTKTLLEREGASVIVSPNGLDGLDKFEENDIDIILLDMQMPGLNGLETEREIRRIEGGAEIPIIMMTSHSKDEINKEFFENDLNTCFMKPVTKEKLLNAMSGGKNKEEEISLPEKIADISYLNKILGDNKEMEKMFIERLLETYPEQIENIKKSISEKKEKKMEFFSHKLKGSLANFDAKRAMYYTRELEIKGRKADFSNCEFLLGELKKELSALEGFLKRYT